MTEHRILFIWGIEPMLQKKRSVYHLLVRTLDKQEEMKGNALGRGSRLKGEKILYPRLVPPPVDIKSITMLLPSFPLLKLFS